MRCVHNSGMSGTMLASVTMPDGSATSARACAAQCSSFPTCQGFVLQSNGGCTLRGNLGQGPNGVNGPDSTLSYACAVTDAAWQAWGQAVAASWLISEYHVR